MAVSKRVRYEVLRRDNHACRYCGGAAPDVVLTVDHVVPVALGGGDDPSNLVAACRDCNAGKSSASPDAAVVADVQADALRWAAAIRQAGEEVRSQRSEREEALAAVGAAWASFRRLPTGWKSSVEAFLDAGLPVEVLVELADVANSTRGVDNRWGYFCGCCWKRIRQLQDRALEIVGELPPPSVAAVTRVDPEPRPMAPESPMEAKTKTEFSLIDQLEQELMEQQAARRRAKEERNRKDGAL